MQRAVESVRKCLGSLLSTLSTLAAEDAVAKGLYNSLRTYKFIIFTHFLCDILGDLSYLSCFFQQDNLDISQVQSAVEATIANINETYLDCDNIGGEHLTYILDEMKTPLIFEDHEIIQRSSDEHECFTSMRTFAAAVVSNIEERFPDLPIWSALKIFDPLSYPSKATQLRGFGSQNVLTLMDYFGKPKVIDGREYKELVDPSLFQREWPSFKRSLFDNYRGPSFKQLAREIIIKKRNSFPVISKLLEFIVVLPMSSVPCERGFSKHNRIRTKFRQQLIVGTVKSLMFVSVNGPDPDYLQPLEHWKKRRKRRHIYCSVSDKLV